MKLTKLNPALPEKSKRWDKEYRDQYVEPDRISSDEVNTSHKVIYCVATLDPQITPEE